MPVSKVVQRQQYRQQISLVEVQMQLQIVKRLCTSVIASVAVYKIGKPSRTLEMLH